MKAKKSRTTTSIRIKRKIFPKEEEICRNIFEIDRVIRFVAIYNKNGKKIAGGLRPGLVSHLTKDKADSSILQELNRWKSFSNFKTQLGNVQYSLVKYDKVMLVTILLNKTKFLMVSLEAVADIFSIMSKIQYFVMNY